MNKIFQGYKLLLVEDDQNFAGFLSKELEDYGLDVKMVHRGAEAVRKAKKQEFDLILLDLKLPDVEDDNLLKILNELRTVRPHALIIVMTGEGKIEHAVQATKQGAYDFLEKPVSFKRLLIPLRNALELIELRRERNRYQEQVAGSAKLIGKSACIQDIMNRIVKCAPTNSPVMITGETGTGKELVAKSILLASKRSREEYVKLNCAAIPKELLESELFGHVRGSFTGAIKDKPGKFQLADQGTLFLDEIGDLDLTAQSKLLRVLEDGEITPIGAEKPIHVDVRLISATNKHLEALVKEGKFREDLFYRLSTIVINVPPLKERTEDIHLLADAFLQAYIRDNGLIQKELSSEALSKLMMHEWPGNVRHLKSVVEYLCIFSVRDVITDKDVELALRRDHITPEADDLVNLKDATNEFQRKIIIAKLSRNDWNIAKTAEELGVNRTHFYKKLEDLGIPKQQH
ncbi:sigma-54 dependent transcriptional regulator [bacterium]|nr:sigma-54 dependent transcriptional regulator [bacterium]MBU1650825.1 sigma-54 dependent transcriptional regulator [bacterium]